MSTNPAPASENSPASTVKKMDDIVALCRRRGFIWQSSEIYGGINGFWDYGPLGSALKRNLKNAWFQDIIQCPPNGPDGKPIDMVSVDCTIIMHPKVWIASGHAAGFNDPMVACKTDGCKKLFRADHLKGIRVRFQGHEGVYWASSLADGPELRAATDEFIDKLIDRRSKTEKAPVSTSSSVEYHLLNDPACPRAEIPCPVCKTRGSLTEPRQFNLMFESHAGAIKDEDNKVWLRPETAQGIFTQFWNVIDTSRVKVPFGIAQQGKAFRNEVTPRNFTFRSREFEQMEIEFFIPHPDSLQPGDLSPVEWYQYWRNSRYQWWQDMGLAGDNLQLREHDKDELSHYAKEGAGVCDVEYRFPFTAPGFGELEGIAHRADFDLKAHATHCGKGDKMKYFDQDLQVKLQAKGLSKEEIAAKCRYFPHVIEPSAGADRGTLALLCEAYTPDPSRASGVFMKFTPRMAPIKAGVFPLVNKDGMPEIAEKLHRELRGKWAVDFDEKQTIGKRYARMDEAGTPFCFTIDGETPGTQTVTVRHRDTQAQERIGIDKVGAFLAEKIGG